MTCVTLAVSFLGDVPFDETGRARSVLRAYYSDRYQRFSRSHHHGRHVGDVH
jgi:hypothetical protein